MSDKSNDRTPVMIRQCRTGTYMSLKMITKLIMEYIKFNVWRVTKGKTISESDSDFDADEPDWKIKMTQETQKASELLRMLAPKYIAQLTGTGEIIELINPEYNREDFWPTLFKMKCQECKDLKKELELSKPQTPYSESQTIHHQELQTPENNPQTPQKYKTNFEELINIMINNTNL